jgi:hypothetical protein
MTAHRYASRALMGDWMRAGIGLGLTAGPAALVPVGSSVQYVLVPLAVLFAVFSYRTWRRQVARVELQPHGISVLYPNQAIRLSWHKITSVRLNFYSTRSDRAGGWMQLTIKGSDESRDAIIRLDSALEGFGDLARRAAAAAVANRLALPAATHANFGALGIDCDALARPTIEPLNSNDEMADTRR